LETTTTTKPRQSRSIEEAVSYAVGHRIRIEVLGILNEGPRSPSEIAKQIDQGLSKVGHHIKELVDSGCIELARVEQVRNTNEHFYRAVELPFVSDEEARDLPPEVKQEFAAVILQAIMAEGLAALWAGKLNSDDDIWMSWRWFNLDAEGRREVADEQAASWARVIDIEGRSAARLAETGDAGTSTIVAGLGFERCRPVDGAGPASHRFASRKG
jgi:DNA-binding transcriptional ArsR family regulator